MTGKNALLLPVNADDDTAHSQNEEINQLVPNAQEKRKD